MGCGIKTRLTRLSAGSGGERDGPPAGADREESGNYSTQLNVRVTAFFQPAYNFSRCAAFICGFHS